MNKLVLDKKFNDSFARKYRYPIWLTIFFCLLFSIPLFAYLGFSSIAKILGFFSLVLVIIALRVWLQAAKQKSSKLERIVLNRNQIFELERKYFFLKEINNSDRQIIFHRTGLLLAEIKFISNEPFTTDEIIEIAFNISIKLFDKEYIIFLGKELILSRKQSVSRLSIADLPNFDSNCSFGNYKVLLEKSNFGDKIVEQLF